MTRMHRLLLVVLLLAGFLPVVELPAQLRPQPVGELPGDASLKLWLRKLASTGTFMQTTAHPDDEDNALLAMLGHGQGMRTVLVSATRGDGGQNEIGPELFQALGVLRTEELLAVHRFDGAEQFFTRAVDFGYSFSVEESLERWGRDEIVGDYVRLIRETRPDVIAGFLCGGSGGGQHHQASTRLSEEAFAAAADPARYPDQIKAGLRPWRAQRFFCTEGASFSAQASAKPATAGLLTPDVSVYDSILGRTYAELGLEARSMHKCQGTSQLLLLPGMSQQRIYRLMATRADDRAGAAPSSMFADIDTTLTGLARFAPTHRAALLPALSAIAAHVEAARVGLDTRGAAAAVPHLAAGLSAVRALRGQVTQPSQAGGDGSELFEVDFRLGLKEQQFQQALLAASGIRLEALASDGLVIPGQTVTVRTHVSNQAPEPIAVTRVSLSPVKPDAAACAGPVATGRALSCEGAVVVPPDARYSSPYWKPRRDTARYDFEPGVPFGRAVHAVAVPRDVHGDHRRSSTSPSIGRSSSATTT